MKFFPQKTASLILHYNNFNLEMVLFFISACHSFSSIEIQCGGKISLAEINGGIFFLLHFLLCSSSCSVLNLMFLLFKGYSVYLISRQKMYNINPNENNRVPSSSF